MKFRNVSWTLYCSSICTICSDETSIKKKINDFQDVCTSNINE